MLRHPIALCILGSLTLLLSACEQAQDPTKLLQQAQSLTPKNNDLEAIYQRSCIACHTSSDTQAPLVGDQKAWRPRLDKGMNTLLDHVINGFGGMPPFGLCMDCSEEEFESLIHFMAQTGSHSGNINKDNKDD